MPQRCTASCGFVFALFRRVNTWVGISGWLYPPWRGTFYREGLPGRRWLEYASRAFNFMQSLPRSSREAERIARRHDFRLKRGECIRAVKDVPYRHAFEVRHPSYFTEEFYDILREHDCAFVIADTAGKFPYAEELTAEFVYVRLHGSKVLYASGYTDHELSSWAKRLRAWRDDRLHPRDLYVYFDNTDNKSFAPLDAARLAKKLARPRTVAKRRVVSSERA